MPCMSGMSSSDIANSYATAAFKRVQRLEKQISEADYVTRYLCAVCTYLESNGVDVDVLLRDAASRADGVKTNEITTWWAHHKARDAA